MKNRQKLNVKSSNALRSYPKFSNSCAKAGSDRNNRWNNNGYVGDLTDTVVNNLRHCCGFGYSREMENEVTVVSFTKNDLIPIQHRLVVVWFTKEDKDYFEDPKYPTLEELKLFTLSNPSCNALYEYAVWFLQKYSHVDHKPRSVSLRSFNGVSSDVVTKVLSQGDGKWEYEREKARKVRDERIRIEREALANINLTMKGPLGNAGIIINNRIP